LTSLEDWKWQWNPMENQLAKLMETGWRIWLPQQLGQSNRLKCHPTDLYMVVNPQFQRAVVELHGHQVFFQGSQSGQPTQQPRCTDFVTAINSLEYAPWAFALYKTSDNGQQITDAVRHGLCEAVSDGSYKDGSGTAAWMIQDMLSKQVLSGTTIIPGHTSDQSAYQSELGGIFSIVTMIHNICNYYNISKGMI